MCRQGEQRKEYWEEEFKIWIGASGGCDISAGGIPYNNDEEEQSKEEMLAGMGDLNNYLANHVCSEQNQHAKSGS